MKLEIFKKILNSFPGKLYYVDKHHNILYSNQGEEYENLSIYDLFSEEEKKEFMKQFGYCKISKSSVEYIIFKQKPFQKWNKYTITPYFDVPGRLEGYSLFIEDITEKKLLEQKILESQFIYYEAFKSIGIGIWEYNRKLKIFNINDTLKNMFRLDSNIISLNKWLTLIHEDDWKKIEIDLKNSIKNKSNTLLSHTYRLKVGDEEYIWVNSLGRIIKYDKDGKPSKSLGIIQNITNQVEAEEKLKEYNKKLEIEVKKRTAELQTSKREAEMSNIAKSEFLSDMSYEFFTLLNIILNSAEIIERKFDKIGGFEDIKKTIKNIRLSGESLNKLVNNMLFLTKLDLNTVNFKFYKTDIISLLNSLNMEVKSKYGKEIFLEILTSVRYIYCDSINIKRVLWELILNSLKHAPGKDIYITVTNNENNIVFEVKDDGEGVPVSEIDKIFNSFFTINEKENSKGLGLSICREIIKKHGGKIRAENLKPKGFAVIFSLPLGRE